MKAGDLVLFKSDGSWWDFLIKIVSPDYTHVGVAISPYTIIEAHSGGLRFKELEELNNSIIHVYAVEGIKNRMTAVNELQFFDFRKYLFEQYLLRDKYSHIQAISAGILRKLGLRSLADVIDQNWFCSEYAAYLIYTYFGVRLCEHLALQDILPTDLTQDERVKYSYTRGSRY